jgi:hypothetical protein
MLPFRVSAVSDSSSGIYCLRPSHRRVTAPRVYLEISFNLTVRYSKWYIARLGFILKLLETVRIFRLSGIFLDSIRSVYIDI